MCVISRCIKYAVTNGFNNQCVSYQDVLSKKVKPILRSDEEKEPVWRHPEEQKFREEFSETFV